jgi:hypothetical protein
MAISAALVWCISNSAVAAGPVDRPHPGRLVQHLPGFLGYSPDLKNADALLAYEDYWDGPFQNPLSYRRDNASGNFTQRISSRRSAGFRFNGARK